MSPEETKSLDVEVDLFGCCYYLIKYWLVEQDIKEIRRSQQQEEPQQQPRLYTAPSYGLTAHPPPGKQYGPVIYALHQLFSKYFDPTFTRIHAGDIQGTVQKSVGIEKREKQKRDYIDHLESATEALPSFRGRKKAAAIKSIRKRFTDARPILDEDVMRIAQGLIALGWDVCICRGESDVCVARNVLGPSHVACSGDSDLFFHSTVHQVLRRTKRGAFFLYKIEDVRRGLKLSETQYLTLGVVSRSDYALNVKDIGLARNTQRLSQLSTPRVPDAYVRHAVLLDRLLYRAIVQTRFATDAASLRLIKIFVSLAHDIAQKIHQAMQESDEEDEGDNTASASSVYDPSVSIADSGQVRTGLASLRITLDDEVQDLSDDSLSETYDFADTRAAISAALASLRTQAKSLLNDAINVLEGLLRRYRASVGSNRDNTASFSVYIKQHEDAVSPWNQDCRKMEMRSDYNSYDMYLSAFVASQAPRRDPEVWQQRPRIKKIYSVHRVDLTVNRFAVEAGPSSDPSPPPPSPPPPPQDAPASSSTKPLTKRQQEAKARREAKKKEREAKKLAAKKEKEAKKLAAKKEKEAKKLAAKRELEASQAAGSQRKTKRRKRNPRLMKYSKSGKGARSAKLGLIDIESKRPKAKRTVALVTREKKRLERAHGIVSLETGSIHGVLAKNLHAFHKVQRQHHSLPTVATQYDIALLANSIQYTMIGIVDYLNTSRQWIHLVVDLLIAKEVAARRESDDESDSPILMALLHQRTCQSSVASECS
ncbi:hypothetical protein BGX28_000499 [Mortierella sp. GBA30]|nr:hypothetical protein BGX28_000499 [Mortierella sp. GBA30]